MNSELQQRCVCVCVHTLTCVQMCEIPYSVSSITTWSYMAPCWLNFTTIVYVTFGSSVPTIIAYAYHYLQCEICAIEQGKTAYVYNDYSKMLGQNCCSCYKNYSLARNSSVLQGIWMDSLLKTRHLDPGEA